MSWDAHLATLVRFPWLDLANGLTQHGDLVAYVVSDKVSTQVHVTCRCGTFARHHSIPSIANTTALALIPDQQHVRLNVARCPSRTLRLGGIKAAMLPDPAIRTAPRRGGKTTPPFHSRAYSTQLGSLTFGGRPRHQSSVQFAPIRDQKLTVEKSL